MPSVRATGATHTLRYGCRQQEERNIDDQAQETVYSVGESHKTAGADYHSVSRVSRALAPWCSGCGGPVGGTFLRPWCSGRGGPMGGSEQDRGRIEDRRA